jgi:hypothetical protein
MIEDIRLIIENNLKKNANEPSKFDLEDLPKT